MASIASALKTLADAGVDVSALTSELLTAQAQEVFDRKCNAGADLWVQRAFDWAEVISGEIKSERKNVQGGAERIVHMFGIDTPHGHLSVTLKSEV